MGKKQIAFPITEEEHARIKALAAKRRRSIKRFMLDMLDKLYPGWDREEKEGSPK